jgi:hypothetical protein
MGYNIIKYSTHDITELISRSHGIRGEHAIYVSVCREYLIHIKLSTGGHKSMNFTL